MASATRPAPVDRRPEEATRPTHTLAPMSYRIVGAAIDMALLVVIAGLATAWLSQRFVGVVQVRIDPSGGSSMIAPTNMPLWLPVALLLLLSAAYTISLMALWGRTIGGWCVGIRAVHVDTGGPLGWRSSARRWVLLYGVAGVIGLLPVVGGPAWLLTLIIGLSPLWDSGKRLQGYADHWAQDVVVRAPWHH